MSFADVEQALRDGCPIPAVSGVRLGQCLPYRHYLTGNAPRERGVAQLTAQDGHLIAFGAFEDHDIHNRARADNDFTWETGDVFELFFQVRGHEDYIEAHATPEGFRLQLHIQSWQTIRQEPWDSKATDFGTVVTSVIRRQENLWLARLDIPCERIALSDELLPGSRFVFAHYSYTTGHDEPEITSTAAFPKTCHFVPLWHELVP